ILKEKEAKYVNTLNKEQKTKYTELKKSKQAAVLDIEKTKVVKAKEAEYLKTLDVKQKEKYLSLKKTEKAAVKVSKDNTKVISKKIDTVAVKKLTTLEETFINLLDTDQRSQYTLIKEIRRKARQSRGLVEIELFHKHHNNFLNILDVDLREKYLRLKQLDEETYGVLDIKQVEILKKKEAKYVNTLNKEQKTKYTELKKSKEAAVLDIEKAKVVKAKEAEYLKTLDVKQKEKYLSLQKTKKAAVKVTKDNTKVISKKIDTVAVKKLTTFEEEFINLLDTDQRSRYVVIKDIRHKAHKPHDLVQIKLLQQHDI